MVLAEMAGKLLVLARWRASSAQLQWAKGTPELRGKPQARAVTRARASAEKWRGAPGRGKSLRLRVPSHRRRHLRTRRSLTSSERAMSCELQSGWA